LSYGGTQCIECPGQYSDVAKSLLSESGIRTETFYRAYDQKFYSKMGAAAFFDRITFGEDRPVTGMGTTPWTQFLSRQGRSSLQTGLPAHTRHSLFLSVVQRALLPSRHGRPKMSVRRFAEKYVNVIR
jgi:hypothetical protein